ncbi:MAG: TRAP transporter small permease subunit [Chloroflexaceae bacterium]|nr:TRAP transporter small permease subunit [Chloroflexaceae bacterium]NJO05770.1 TRAP transporter small permease subunit [Chloroflexaceae bacterium]
MKALLAVSKGVDTLNEWIGLFAVWLMPVMVLVGVWNVFGRFFGQAIGQNLTSNLFIEMQWYLFSLTYLLGAAYVLRHNGHVRVDVLYDRWSAKTKAMINMLGSALILLPFAGFVIYFSWNWLAASWVILEQSPDPSGLPRYPIKTVLVFGFGLLIIQGISEFIKNLAIYTGAVDPEAEPHKTLTTADGHNAIAHVGDANLLADEVEHKAHPVHTPHAAETQSEEIKQ